MVKIVRTPRKLESFFEELKLSGLLTAAQLKHVTTYLLGLLVTGYRRTVTGITRAIYDGVHRVKRNEFLTRSPMDDMAVQVWLAWKQLQRLGLQAGQTLYLAIDDTHTHKRGKKMQGAGKYRDGATQGFVWGHNVLGGVFYYRGFTIPYRLKVHLKPEQAKELGETFQTLPEMAAEVIRGLQAAAGVRVVVLFDSGYMNKKVVEAVREKGLTYISVLPVNRNLKISGRWTKLGKYRRCIPHSEHRGVSIRTRRGKAKTYWATDRQAWIPSIGSVKLVFSRRKKYEKALPLVTNDSTLSRKEIIEAYDLRWIIEQFWKDAKSHLGLGEYQTTKYAGVVTHLHLVAMAYSLLVDRAIEGWEKKRRSRNDALGAWSLLELRDQIRGFVLEDTLAFLQEQPDPKRAIRELRQMLEAA